MKNHRNILQKIMTLVVAAAPLAASAQTSGYSAENFNTNDGYERNVGIISPAQPANLRWQGNDPYNTNTDFGETDLVTVISNYTFQPESGNSSLVQGGAGLDGGVLPGTNNVQIWKSFNAYSNNSTVSWLAEWAIINSTNNIRDTFSFDLRGANNTTSLLKLNFAPSTATNYFLQAVGATTQAWGTLGYDAIFATQVDITGSSYSLSFAQLDANRNVIVSYTNALSGALASGSAADFDTIGINWVLTSGDNEDPGSNFIVVNDLQAVPEPTTVALLTMAGLTLGLLRRRRRA